MTGFLNGRALRTSAGGVGRFATEVAARLPDLQVVSPPPHLSKPGVGQLWEQTVLARASASGTLLSLANSGPVRHDDHVVVVHDILALTHPWTVSPVFARAQRRLLPATVHGARAVLTVSEWVKGQLIDHLGVDPQRIVVVPPGVAQHGLAQHDVAGVAGPSEQRREACVRLGVAPDRKLVAGLVTSTPRKNSNAVLQVLKHVAGARPDTSVLVAGFDGPSHVFGRGAERPRSDRVRDLGPVDDASLRDLFGAADVFVSMSEAEGFGLPPIEAAALSTAVVSTPIPSVVEHLASGAPDGDSPGAILVTSETEAVDAALGLVDDDTTRILMAKRAQAAAESLTWDRCAARIASVAGCKARQLDQSDRKEFS